MTTKRLMIRSIGVLLVLTTCVSMAAGQEFRLIDPASDAHGDRKAPHEDPGFAHWDLREFPNCRIPWALGTAAVPDLDGDGTADDAADRALAQNTIQSAFDAWEGVTPSLIAFRNETVGVPAGGFAVDGWNTLSFGTSPQVTGGLFGLTIVTRSASSGQIQEVDIVFNPMTPAWMRWVFEADGGTCEFDHNLPPFGVFPGANDTDHDGDGVEEFEVDFQTIATHEVGHLVGLHHNAPLGGSMNNAANALMEQFWNVDNNPAAPHPHGAHDGGWANHTLKDSDQDGCNFLYCPDLGDAPNIDRAVSPQFSSLVHGVGGGRTLNGVNLPTPSAGPSHKFGIKRRQVARNFTYEWIGTAEGSDVDAECEANVVNRDKFDDGVRFEPDPPRWGEEVTIHVDIQTAIDAYGAGHDYAAHNLFVNLWIDLNTNKQWEPAERVLSNHALNGAGTCSATVMMPVTEKTVWVRARLDYGEQVQSSSFGVAGLSPGLNLHEGAAQFGEVEDYPLACRPVYDRIVPQEDLTFFWTRNGDPILDEPWYYDVITEEGDMIRVDTTGALDARETHPEFDGQVVSFCFFPPREPTDWRQEIIRENGSSDVYAGNLQINPMTGQYEFVALEVLPGVAWRIPDLAPVAGGGTIYTAVNLAEYYLHNSLGFNQGAWQTGQTISEVGVVIVDGQVPGLQGIYWATTEFVFDPNSPTGFSPIGGDAALLNSETYPVELEIVEQHASSLTPATVVGACCIDGSDCVDGALPEDCPGEFAQGQSCAQLEPPCQLLPEGACCGLTGCADGVPADLCDGEFFEDLVCSAIPCGPVESGSCCTASGVCLDGVSPENCIGEYSAGGVCDDAAPCMAEPFGACCRPDGTCSSGATLLDCDGTFFAEAGCQELDCGGGGGDDCIIHADCADLDGNGIRDDNCLHWACIEGACVATSIVFADMGGQFGQCAPDGSADGNDRFHALNCFADTGAGGMGDYPCEDTPPQAYNVDAGGPFGDCSPDGVCDGNDAFHALNAFAGASDCVCVDGGPAPEVTIDVVGAVDLELRPRASVIQPGHSVEVDVLLVGSIEDLRGYQLHLETSGGTSGSLEIVDLAISSDPAVKGRPAHVFDDLAYWSAFNVDTHQMVAGLDAAGVPTHATAYLATATLQASRDARGQFAIDVRHGQSPEDRTFLFGTPMNGKIAIGTTIPAIITVPLRVR